MLDIRPEVAAALRDGRPVVALESTLIAHGLPWPRNRDTAEAAEAAVRSRGGVPATIAVWAGRPTIGLNVQEREQFAQFHLDRRHIRKASRRDLAAAVAEGAHAATTVAATMFLAHKAGIRVFATGGIGGVHREEQGSAFDVSADLHELGRTPVAVVCSGAKSILDLPATLEVLETQGVPVVGYRTRTFPTFYVATSDLRLDVSYDTPEQIACLLRAHWELDGAGVVVAQQAPSATAVSREVFAAALAEAEKEARAQHVLGSELTPFLLKSLQHHTGGKTLEANQDLIVANAGLAAEIAMALSRG
jgi:pseudouridylate synthase